MCPAVPKRPSSRKVRALSTVLFFGGALVSLETCNGGYVPSVVPPPAEDDCYVPEFVPSKQFAGNPQTLFEANRFLFELPAPREGRPESGSDSEIDQRVQRIPKNYLGTVPNPDRIARIVGNVSARDDAEQKGLRCVSVSVLNHEEYGTTVSRGEGRFDLAVTGGTPITLVFEKRGYLPVQRIIYPDPLEYIRVDDVRLIPIPKDGTKVRFSELSEVAVVRGARVEDESRARQVTMLVRPGTRVVLKRPVLDKDKKPTGNYTEREAPELTFRAVEYTVGPQGVAAMPGPLSENAAYTLAFNISAQETEAEPATSIEFQGQPVYVYVENFLGFATGAPVPSGFYNRALARWEALDNGVVIKILAVVDGKAVLDVTGTGREASPRSLERLDITDAELIRIGALYKKGDSLFRVPHQHFTDIDYNWPVAPPKDADMPPSEPIQTGAQLTNGICTSKNGSSEGVIPNGPVSLDCKRRIAQIDFPLLGTDLKLRYHSCRVQGCRAGLMIQVPLTSSTGIPVPQSMQRIDVTIATGGNQPRRYTYQVPHPVPSGWSERYSDFYDGINVNGQLEDNTVATVHVRAGFPGVYVSSVADARARIFGQWSGNIEVPTGNPVVPSREQFWLSRRHTVTVQTNRGTPLRMDGMGLVQHPWLLRDQGKLFWDDGEVAEDAKPFLPFSLISAAGNGISGFSDSNNDAPNSRFGAPFALATNNNSVLMSDASNCQIFQIDGTQLERKIGYANLMSQPGCGDPQVGPGMRRLTDVYLKQVDGLAINGSRLFFSVPALHRVYVADLGDNTLYSVIGTGSPNTTVGTTRGAIGLDSPHSLLTIPHNDRTKQWLLIGDKERVLAVAVPSSAKGTDPTTWPGLIDGDVVVLKDFGDNLSTVAASMGLAYDSNSRRLYVADTDRHCIHEIDASDVSPRKWSALRTFGKCNERGFAAGQPKQQRMASPSGLATDSQWLYVADSGNGVVRRITLADGEITTIAGKPFMTGNPCQQAANPAFAGDYCLGTPVGLALTSSMTGAALYVSDSQNHRIYKLEPTLKQRDLAGNLLDFDLVPIRGSRLPNVTHISFQRGSGKNGAKPGEPLQLFDGGTLKGSYAHVGGELRRFSSLDLGGNRLQASYMGSPGELSTLSAGPGSVQIKVGHIDIYDGEENRKKNLSLGKMVNSLSYEVGDQKISWDYEYYPDRGGLLKGLTITIRDKNGAILSTQVHAFQYDQSGRVLFYTAPDNTEYSLSNR